MPGRDVIGVAKTGSGKTIVTVSGPSPHTSRPMSRSDHARASVSAFGMYHFVRFGTDLLGSSLALFLITLRSIATPIRSSMYITQVSSPRVLGEPTCIFLSLLFALARSRLPTSDLFRALACSDPRTITTIAFLLPMFRHIKDQHPLKQMC